MKRAHRKTHIWLWLGLTPAIIAVLVLAVQMRPSVPINDTPLVVDSAGADLGEGR